MILMHHFYRAIALAIVAFFCFTNTAYAYLDPGSGSVLFSTLVAVFGAIAYSLKSFYYRLLGRKTDEELDAGHDTLVVFSEGKSYWGTFRPLVNELIRRKIHFRYISMDLHDPALQIDSEYMHAKLYPKNNWSFAKLGKIRTPLMLATTPNIGSDGYPMKRSDGIDKLVHVFHAMSGTSNYVLGGLDFYDQVIMVGPHQEEDLRTIEGIRNIQRKEMVALGLPYLDDLLAHIPDLPKEEKTRKTILVAPSWGDKGCFNEYGTGFVRELAKYDYDIIIRLHPHSKNNEPEKVAQWEAELAGLENVIWDQEAFAHKAMGASDILISDTSSIRFDYAFLYLKPVLTLDIPKESRENFEAVYFDITWSETSSYKIGTMLDHQTLDQLPETLAQMFERDMAKEIETFRDETIQNFGNSSEHIVEYVMGQMPKKGEAA